MLFSSLSFLFFFLPLVLAFYFIIPKKFIKIKNIILLLFSLIFYAWGEPKYVIVMLATIFVSYIFGILIDKTDNKKKKKLRLGIFILSIICVVSSLVYFKYLNFILENVSLVFNVKFNVKNVVLPIGISFYTFQILTYLIDVYRKKVSVQKNFFNLALYISFFPQLIAGPIVKYETIEDALGKREETFDKFVSGLERFIIGLGKKIIIANQMALIADLVFDYKDLANLSFLVLLLGILAYTMQIYFDFSGYSDMAIGLGKMFGFEFLENFNYPYIAKSVTDFWRRWHISLTTFFREYVYIPLGGNRVKKYRWIINMLIVWLLTGLWHGAAWTFIIWGIYYFVLLIIEKEFLNKILDKIPEFIRVLLTFIIVNIGWTIFRANNLSDLVLIFKTLLTGDGSINLSSFIISNIDIVVSLCFLPVAIILCTNIFKKIDSRFNNNWFYLGVKYVFLLGVLGVCICFLTSNMYNPFIYFRF